MLHIFFKCFFLLVVNNEFSVETHIVKSAINIQLLHRDSTSESKHQMNKDIEDRIIKLLEIFPQKSKKDLLEVKSPSLV